MYHYRRRHTFVPGALVAALALSCATPAAAQQLDEFFDPNTVQEIRLTINTRDLRELREKYLENTYYTADVQWRGVRVRNAGVRSRGNSSRNDNKMALRVDADRYVTGQRFLGLKSFVLKNLWNDPSMLRERLALTMFSRLGQPASRHSYCRLYINNEFQGLYIILESVDNQFLTRTLGENNGYLYSYQLQSEWRGEYLGEELNAYKDRFEPQNHEKETDAMLYLPIHDWLREVNHSDDGVWRDRVEEYVDLSQFMTHVATEVFLAENDGLIGATGMNNFFLYRAAGTKRHRFLPWDKDSSFLLWDFSIFERTNDNVLFRRAFAYPDLREVYWQALEAAARSAAEEDWLEAEITRAAELISGTVEEDNRKQFSTEEFLAQVEWLKQFARLRSRLVLEQLAAARGRR
jgi:spore coat protein H